MRADANPRRPYTNRAGERVDVLADFRAPAGGCYGLSGSYYEGGQFLPSSERPGGFAKGSPDPEAEAKRVQAEAEMIERRNRNARIAQEPANVWVLEWLATCATPTVEIEVTHPGNWQDVRDSSTRAFDHVHLLARHNAGELDARLQAGTARTALHFESTFLRDMHRELSLWGQRPCDLSNRQFHALASVYARVRGRVGSGKYDSAYAEFCTYALTPEVAHDAVS